MNKFFSKTFKSKLTKDAFGSSFWSNESAQLAQKSANTNSKLMSKVLLGCTLLGYLGYENVYKNKNIRCANISKNQAYSWGWGQYGQLGHGNETNAYVPTRIEELQTLDVKTISAGPLVSAAITKDGKILTWGKAKGGVLGHLEFTSSNITLPTTLSAIAQQRFTQVACGYQHMAAINDSGELFTWGNSDHGKLGHELVVPHEEKKNSRRLAPKSPNATLSVPPQKVGGDLSTKKVLQVSCGHSHTICLAEDGEVYVWGSKNGGVLGFDAKEDAVIPKKLESFSGKNIAKVGAGYDFNIVLTKDGSLYSWGTNNSGQLGDPSRGKWDAPAQLGGLSGVKIVDFACGANFAAALSSTGEVYTWGAGLDGQLGHGDRSDSRAPKILDFNKPVRAVSCGNGHSAILTKDNQLYMFGRGKEGQLGRADAIESSVAYRATPQKVETFKNKKIVQVECGGDHTLTLVE